MLFCEALLITVSYLLSLFFQSHATTQHKHHTQLIIVADMTRNLFLALDLLPSFCNIVYVFEQAPILLADH